MVRSAPDHDIDERDVEVGHPKQAAAGTKAVAVTMKRAVEQMGVRRTAQTLLKLNQTDGFDCQGCAWPDPEAGHRHTAEFCENGAKAVTEEATLRRVDRDFFARHSLSELAGKTDYWLGQQGRLTEPMVRRRGADPLRADLLGRRVHPGRRSTARPRQPRRSGLLHLGSHLQRGRLLLPALRPRVRDQQPARLLQHVPRVDLGRARRGDRHRQGQRQPPGRPGGRADRRRGAEPGHQPPADAVRAGGGQEERRPDPGDQPAQGSRAGQVQQPPEAGRARRPRYVAGRPAPPGAGQRRPRALPGDRFPPARLGQHRPRLRGAVHRRVRCLGRARRRGRLGGGGAGDRAAPRPDRARPHRCSATPRPP